MPVPCLCRLARKLLSWAYPPRRHNRRRYCPSSLSSHCLVTVRSLARGSRPRMKYPPPCSSSSYNGSSRSRLDCRSRSPSGTYFSRLLTGAITARHNTSLDPKLRFADQAGKYCGSRSPSPLVSVFLSYSSQRYSSLQLALTCWGSCLLGRNRYRSYPSSFTHAYRNGSCSKLGYLDNRYRKARRR